MDDWRIQAKKLRFEQHKSWTKIAKELKVYFPDSEEYTVRERIRRYLRSCAEYNEGKIEKSAHINRSTVSLNKDGTISRELTVELMQDKELTKTEILKLHNLDENDWQILTYTNNYWESQNESGKVLMCQSKLTVKPRSKTEMTIADVDNYFRNKTYKPILPQKSYDIQDNYHKILEIDIADLHSGLYSTENICGEEYNLKEAERRLIESALEIKARSEGKGIKKVELALLGDILHVENENQETVKGTFQQTDDFLAEIIDGTISMLIQAIDIISDIAPTRVTWVSGNHSHITEYMIMKCVQTACKGVVFDLEYNPIKSIKIGKNAIVGLSHGDMPKKNLANDVDRVARQIGGIEFIENHSGHQHSEMAYIERGIVIRSIPAMCASSKWEHSQGYLSSRAVAAFVWSETNGIYEYWVYNL